MSATLKRFRWISLAEGVSFLALLLVAMPLKYMAGIDVAVKVVGWAHGLLFILYMGALINVTVEENWSLGRTILFFVGAFVPAGPFMLDSRLRGPQQTVSNSAQDAP